MKITSLWMVVLACLLVVLAGCAANVEGDEVGECSDGADNDQDGFADCADDSCAADTACAGDDDDTGDDDTGDDDSAAGTDADGDGVTVEDGDCDDSDPAVTTTYPGDYTASSSLEVATIATCSSCTLPASTHRSSSPARKWNR